MLWGKPKFENFHRYEIRCNSPIVAFQKMWTAFWIFGWSTEVDIFEFIGSKDSEFSVHKWFGNGQTYTKASGKIGIKGLLGSFHTYAMEHDKFFIRFYIDNKIVYTVSLIKYLNNIHQLENCEISDGIYEKTMSFPDCNEPALSVIVDPGATPNAAHKVDDLDLNEYVNDPNFPLDFLIDYIRVYKIVSNEEESSCYMEVLGPNTSCSEIDTIEFCNKGIQMNSNSWRLPKGMIMYQNSSLNISKRKITINGVETIVMDTTINKNCIKVRTDGSFTGGTIYYRVPEECKFLKGNSITKKVFTLLPKANVTYQVSSCDVRVCIEGGVVDAYDEIWWSEKSERIKGTDCWIIKDVKYGGKPPYVGIGYIHLLVRNKCGKSLSSIKIVNENCIENPGINDESESESAIVLIPNPASDQFTLKKFSDSDHQFEYLYIVNVQNNNVVKELAFNGNEELLIDSSSFANGEYLVLVRDTNNIYHRSTLIINQN